MVFTMIVQLEETEVKVLRLVLLQNCNFRTMREIFDKCVAQMCENDHDLMRYLHILSSLIIITTSLSFKDDDHRTRHASNV